jgi:hypothetical protein
MRELVAPHNILPIQSQPESKIYLLELNSHNYNQNEQSECVKTRKLSYYRVNSSNKNIHDIRHINTVGLIDSNNFFHQHRTIQEVLQDCYIRYITDGSRSKLLEFEDEDDLIQYLNNKIMESSLPGSDFVYTDKTH